MSHLRRGKKKQGEKPLLGRANENQLEQLPHHPQKMNHIKSELGKENEEALLDDEQIIAERSLTPPPSSPVPPTIPAGGALDADSTVVDDSFVIPSSAAPSQAGAVPQLPRHRPRFQTVQALDVALHQAIEGKINPKNAWVSKEASDLLEGIVHTVEQTLEAHREDEYGGFAKVATVVEGCSKVWTSRVDSTYRSSNQMVQRLLRNDDSGKNKGGDKALEDEEAEEEEVDPNDALAVARQKKREMLARKDGAAASAARTLALDASEINLDRKAAAALTQTGVKAQFRAITEKFDQSHAEGLLLNNAPLGRAGNWVLDEDYSLPAASKRIYSARERRQREAERKEEAESGEDIEEPVDEEEEGNLVDGRVVVEEAEPVETFEFPADLPTSWGQSLAVLGLQNEASLRSSLEHRAELSAGTPAEAQPTDARGFLLLDHSTIAHGARGSTKEANALPTNPSGVVPAPHEEGDENGEVGGGEDYAYDDDVEADDGFTADPEEVAALGLQAERLIRGTEELDQAHFEGENEPGSADGAAAAAVARRVGAAGIEDSTESWCILKDPQGDASGSAAMLGGVPLRSELSRLHMAHKFAAPPPPTGTRGAKAVTFDLPSLTVGSPTSNGSTNVKSSSTASLLERAAEGAGLEQAPTLRRHLTPLGKSLLLDKNASDNALAFTQTLFQRQKAEAHHLVLPPPLRHLTRPRDGETVSSDCLPSYLPLPPVPLRALYQPFSTHVPHWNVLEKAASSAGPAAAAVPHRSHGSSGAGLHRGDNEEEEDEALPIDSIPGEAYHSDNGVDDYGGYGDLDDESFADDAEREENQRRQAEWSLLAQLQSNAQKSSAGPSTRSSALLQQGGRRFEIPAEEIASLAQSLQSAEPALLQSVNVSLLRQLMWECIQAITGMTGEEKVVDLEATMKAAEVEGSRAVPLAAVAEDAASALSPSIASPTVMSLLKPAARKLLSETEMASAAPLVVDQNEEEEATDDEPLSKKARVEASRAGDVRSAAAALAAHPSSLSEVTLRLLPQIKEVSASGILSPAFLFFSLLFVANENGVVLESAKDGALNDLSIVGVAPPVDAVAAVEEGSGSLRRKRGRPA